MAAPTPLKVNLLILTLIFGAKTRIILHEQPILAIFAQLVNNTTQTVK